MWLSVLGSDVTRLIIDDKCQSAQQHSDGDVFRFKTEKAAISWLEGKLRAPNAMVISGAHERQTPLLSFLDEQYPSRRPLILEPPDPLLSSGVRLSEMQDCGCSRVEQFSHDDLEAARLVGHDSLWVKYLQSRDRRAKATRWSAYALSQLRPHVTSKLDDKGPHRDPERWLNWANGRNNVEGIRERVKRVLESCFSEDRHLAQEEDCIEFIARSMIKIVADDIYDQRWGRDPEKRPSICSGRDLIAQAARTYPAIEICEGAERQILTMTGNEKYFGWVQDAFAKANHEMLAWRGGPFPHDRLPGPASSESPGMNGRLAAMRIFRTRRGEKLPFEYHMKYRGQNQRIHYRVDQGRRRLMIGYVGEHLPY